MSLYLNAFMQIHASANMRLNYIVQQVTFLKTQVPRGQTFPLIILQFVCAPDTMQHHIFRTIFIK